jgi:hypothetical protein
VTTDEHAERRAVLRFLQGLTIRYIVYRPGYRHGEPIPADEMPHGLDGRWDDKTSIRPLTSLDPPIGPARAVKAGRYEIRADGAVAEVYEVMW